MSLLRKKKSTFDESDLPTDNWIWGNTRGGGGAPLKDVQGNDVANLKKVLAGTIEVDHSPSPNSKGRRNNQPNRNSEYDDEGTNYGRQNGRNNSNSAPNRNNGNNRNRQTYDQEDDDDYDRRGGRNNSSQHNNFNPNNHPSSQSNQNAPRNGYNAPNNDRNKRFNPYSDEAPERVIPGLSDPHSNRNHNADPVSPRHVHNNNGASPKKFMGALRELTGGNGERDAKHRKQAEYQEMLRQQIEDNNKKKDKEKREQDEVKRRELAEFMATQPGNKSGGGGGGGVNRGAMNNSEPDYPPVAKKTVPRFRADSDDEYNNSNNNQNGGGGNKIPGLNMGGGKGPALNLPIGDRRNNGGRGGGGGGSYSDEEPEPPRRGGGGGGRGGGRGGGGGSGYDDRDQGRRNGGGRGRATSYDSQEDDYRSDDSRGRGQGGVRGGGGGGRGSAVAADVVPAEEYDELSKLVDRLLTEKAQLQLAVDKQADQLKALKGGKAGPGAGAAAPRSRLAGSPSKPSIARSRSAIQPRERGGGSHAGDTASEEAPRAASNLRISKKELDRERAREAKANLKQYEPLNRNARNAKNDAAGKARPSSMHAMGGSKAYQNEDGGVKKGVKVAFGSNRNLDKNNTGGGSKLAQQGAAVVKGGRKLESPSKDNTAQGRYGQQAPAKRVGGGGMAERDNIGVNGFAKLQQANSRVVGGPVMVVHDEEEPPSRYANARTPSPLRGQGNNNNRGGARGLELRGNSEYIPISGDRDIIGNDQLEKLLRQSRNAR